MFVHAYAVRLPLIGYIMVAQSVLDIFKMMASFPTGPHKHILFVKKGKLKGQ